MLPTSSIARNPHKLIWWKFSLLTVSVHFCLLLYSSWVHSPTDLECNVLPAGYVHLKYGRFDIAQVNPPLSRLFYAVPLLAFDVDEDWRHYGQRAELRPEYAYGEDFVRRNARAIRPMLFACRVMASVVSVLGAIFLYLIAEKLYGSRSGFVALLLWCFSPLVIGHGATVGHDVAGATIIASAFYCFLLLCESTNAWKAALFGFVAGLTLLTRTTCVTILGLLWLSFICKRNTKNNSDWSHRVCYALLSAAVTLYVLNLGYCFRGTFTQLRDYEFFSKSLSGTTDSTTSGNRFRDTVFGPIPVPLPRDYVHGLDLQQRDFESPPFSSYLCGEWRANGWWYYYLVGWIVKTPVGFQFIFGIAVLQVVGQLRWQNRSEYTYLVAAAVAIVFITASLKSGFTIHYRYVFPAYPFIFILCSRIWADQERFQILNRLMIIPLVWGIVACLASYPNCLAFHNIWGRSNLASKPYLLHSSCDWGQDVYKTIAWYKQVESESQEDAFILPYGTLQPQMLEVSVGQVPRRVAPHRGRMANEKEIQPGLYAISIAHLFAEHGGYNYFSSFCPVGRIGFTTNIYDVRDEDITRSRLNSLVAH